MGIEKYYTPELEELHFGFECEVYNSTERYMFEAENGWIKTCIGIVNELRFMPTILSLINDSQIRVKYLDHEDIEECGWVLLEELSGRNKYEKTDTLLGKLILEHDGLNNKITIKTPNYIRDGSGRFDGYIEYVHRLIIKNKSELKKLTKQLNICTK